MKLRPAPPAATPAPSPASPSAEKAAHDARIAWWRDGRFGMFIHWGLYAVPAGEWQGKPVSGIGEWIRDQVQLLLLAVARLARAEFDEQRLGFFLADRNKPLKFSQDGDKLTLTLPAQAPDPLASVVCLEM